MISLYKQSGTNSNLQKKGRSNAGKMGIIFILFYLMAGFFPITPLENDSMRISLGVQSKNIYGDYLYAYEYNSQPGTYKLTEFLSEIFKLEPFHAFSYLTACSCIIFLLSSTVLIKRITEGTLFAAFISVILFQETYISGYYPNSSMIAAAFLTISLLLITQSRKTFLLMLSSIIFAVAVWCRFDAILMAFAFFLLLSRGGKSTSKHILLFGTTLFITITILFAISNISIFNILRAYTEHVGGNIDIKGTLNNYTTIFTLPVIFGGSVGLYLLYRHKRWGEILMGTFVPLPLLIAYGLSLSSPKYLLYASAFWAIPICYGLSFLVRDHTLKSERIIFIGIVLFAGQYIFSPSYELILGRSTIVHTADEARLRGSVLYSPIFWAKQKVQARSAELGFNSKLLQYIKGNNPSYIISHDWMSNQLILYQLQEDGYRIIESISYAEYLEDGQRIVLAKENSRVFLIRWRPETHLDLPTEVQSEIEEMYSVIYCGPDYITEDYAETSFLVDAFDGQLKPEWRRFMIILFKR